MKRTLIACLLLLAAVSCHRSPAPGREPVKLVKDIVSGADAGANVISASGMPASSGEIYIAGAPESCRLLRDKFVSCDIFENVRGRSWSDGLKDFAGETFSCISDWANTPYGELVKTGSADSLRELAVRYALAALDTKYNISVYDLDGNGTKVPAKAIVFPDPWLYEYGKFDVDTLFSITGLGVSVISPQDLMFNAVFGGERKCFNIGLICDSTAVGTGIYPAIFKDKTREHGIMGAKFFEASVSQEPGSLYRFLDAYIASGNDEPLDAIIVDDPRLDKERMEEELQAARDFSREEYMNYGKLISTFLTMQFSSELVMQECYSILRKGSLFTHRIAQPASRSYIVSPRPWVEDMQFLLIREQDDV